PCACDVLAARCRASYHAARWTLLDPDPARIIYEMAERWLPAVTCCSIECRIRFDWTPSRERLATEEKRSNRPEAPASSAGQTLCPGNRIGPELSTRVLRSFLHSIPRVLETSSFQFSPFSSIAAFDQSLIEFRCGGMSLRSRMAR